MRWIPVLTVVALAAVGSLLAGCGDLGATQEELADARHRGERAGRQEARADARARVARAHSNGYDDGWSRGWDEGWAEALTVVDVEGEDELWTDESSPGERALEEELLAPPVEGSPPLPPSPPYGDGRSSGTTEDFGSGRGEVVVCADGTLSDSGGIQGACSHHGGVR